MFVVPAVKMNDALNDEFVAITTVAIRHVLYRGRVLHLLLPTAQGVVFRWTDEYKNCTFCDADSK